MLVNFDCSLMWVRDRFLLTQALVVDPLYLQHSYSESAIDYRVSSKDGIEPQNMYLRTRARYKLKALRTMPIQIQLESISDLMARTDTQT